MARIKLRYVSSEVSRHGKVFYYFRMRGLPNKIRLRGQPGDAAFMADYHACLEGKQLPKGHKASVRQIVPVTDRRSLSWLCQQYLTSRKFQALDVKTRKARQTIFNQLCHLPISETNRKKIGDAPFVEMPSKAIRRIRDRKAETPQAANNWLKAIKALFKWAVEEEYCEENPAKDVPKLSVPTDGFHTWTIEEVAQFESFYAIGTKARLALALLLYTGCRRGDVIELGPQHIKDGWLTYTQQKNRRSNPVTLSLPILPALQEVLDATPCEHLTFLITEHGHPYSADGFSRRWRKWIKPAGLSHCTPHGLRKAGAVRAAEAGATANELMAIFGWRDIKQAERYTKMATQKTLAGEGMDKFARAPKSNVRKLREK